MLGVSNDRFLKKWKNIGLDSTQLKRRLFEEIYSSNLRKISSNKEGTTNSNQGAGLFAVTVDDCELVTGFHGAKLKSKLLLIGDSTTTVLTNNCQTNQCLETVQQLVCSSAQ